MKSYEEIDADMVQGYTFGSMSHFEHWAASWCGRCVHEDSCPIVDAALLKTGWRPAEWIPITGDGEPFTCTELEAEA
jgi:hypothetical protein